MKNCCTLLSIHTENTQISLYTRAEGFIISGSYFQKEYECTGKTKKKGDKGSSLVIKLITMISGKHYKKKGRRRRSKSKSKSVLKWEKSRMEELYIKNKR